MNLLHTELTVSQAIYQRRAVRHYGSREVSRDLVKQLLHAAVQAPSAMNQQPWLFAVFHGRKRLHRYSEMAKRYLIATYPTGFSLHGRSQLYEDQDYDVFHGAGTVIVIYAQRGWLHPNEDCCLAAQNLMLSACALGLATCPIGFVRSWFDWTETKRDLGVPEHYSAVFPLTVGYPDGSTPAPARREPVVVSWGWDDEPQDGLPARLD
ncbi:MAG: nitroreductase [Opitutus sp.]